MRATGLLGVKIDVRDFIQVDEPELRGLADRLKRKTALASVNSVYRFNVREVKYPMRPDGSPALGFLVRAFPWFQHGFFKFYLAEFDQEYAWLLPVQLLKLRYGICVDTANLCTTLLRILNVPAYTVLGVVEAGGDFYGHAWTRAEADGAWYLLETTIHRGRPPVVPLDKVEEKLHIKYVEVACFDERKAYVNRELWDKYRLTLMKTFKGVEP